MIKTDFHTHCRFSQDSNGDPIAMIEAAIEKGFAILCFTDHVDIDFPEELITFDTAEYTEFFKKVREEYKGRIDIRMGVEVGLQPHIAAENDAFVKSAPFDFVIGSTHVIEGLRPNSRRFTEYKERYELKEGVEAYLKDTLKNIQVFDNFDVYGHLDFISTYTYDGTPFSYVDHKDLTDEILKLLIARGKGIELNTADVSSYGMGSPCDDVLKRYRELGGEIITLGSDAHSHKSIGNNIEWGLERLRQCGYRYFTVFRERKLEFIAL